MTQTTEGAELCFPQLLNSSCRKPEPPRSEALLVYILLFVISLLTTVLNLLVIISISHFRHVNLHTHCAVLRFKMTFAKLCYHKLNWLLVDIIGNHINKDDVFCHRRELHTPTNLLLLSLAVSDFLVGLLVMPVEILMTLSCWVLADLICPVYYLLPFIILCSSVVNMVLISCDRYVAICYPLHYPARVTPKVSTVCVILCWVYSVIYSVLILFDNLKHPGRYNSCHGECVVHISGTVDLVVNFLVPVSIIILANGRVFVVAVSQARAMKTNVKVRVKKSELKAAKTLGVLIVVFLMCYSPFYSVALTGHDIFVGSSVEVFMVFLMYFNSCLNPIIYALFYPWFKKTTRLIVTLQILKANSCGAKLL
ncbi:putative trace amine-associated receptor 4-like [Scophthalmus maximus]|uniref:Putative trace amine-associated receptor 4-like n=1 Tax=Scophthalmus maximus TaxID=52904 RepID=A0A2U9CFE4_SCOMX|nr:trace amine-associated receptor 13c-like [Scophthalmus maximus]AWP13582.1 putative trace amine-associated receptor 4-like [Scophthalmus maximus]KAF0026870.1 hypothetical protein F2P81_021607 [Scophthalmus maximus]